MPPSEPVPDAPRAMRGGPQLPPRLGGQVDGEGEPSAPGDDVSPAAGSVGASDEAAGPGAEPTAAEGVAAGPDAEPTAAEGAAAGPDAEPAADPLAATAADDQGEPGAAEGSDTARDSTGSDRAAVAPDAPPSTPSAEAAPSEPPPSPAVAPVSDGPSSPSATSTARPLSRPLLASEALMEDLAPVEPLEEQARLVCVIAGLLFAVLGALPHIGVQLRGPTAFLPSLVVGAVTLFAAIARVSYRQRAVAMVALGAIVAILGIAGMGPARGIAQGGAVWSVARLVAAAVLPAALLFRARYRAFEGARLLLGLAFVGALPFVIHAVLLVVQPGTPFGFAQVGALLAITLVVAGLPGFMGSETTAAGNFVAPAMIAAFALQAGLERLGALVPGSLSEIFGVAQAAVDAAEGGLAEVEVVPAPQAIQIPAHALWEAGVTTLALAASAVLSAVGLFQILAWKFAPAARKIDIRKSTESVTEERHSVEDWSTRH